MSFERRKAIASFIAWITLRVGGVEVAWGVDRVVGVERDLSSRLGAGSASVGSRVTNSSKIWLPRLSMFEVLSHVASTGQASPPSAAWQTFTRASSGSSPRRP